jgi:hypothetical protein
VYRNKTAHPLERDRLLCQALLTPRYVAFCFKLYYIFILYHIFGLKEILTPKSGFCAFLMPFDHQNGLFTRICARDQRLISLEECLDCANHT